MAGQIEVKAQGRWVDGGFQQARQYCLEISCTCPNYIFFGQLLDDIIQVR